MFGLQCRNANVSRRTGDQLRNTTEQFAVEFRSHDNISLTIAAAATMLIAISLLLMIMVGWLQRRSTRMRQSG